MVRVQWLHIFMGFKHNNCASGTLLNETLTENRMQSQYSVRMPFLSIDGVCVCVWDNTHKSCFLESPLMMDILSVCVCALTCQENLEPAFFLPLCRCACKRALIKSY